MSKLLEKLADLEHKRWAGWMLHMYGTETPERHKRWRRLSTTPYSELTEGEKESDRREVRSTLDVINEDHVIITKEEYRALNETNLT